MDSEILSMCDKGFLRIIFTFYDSLDTFINEYFGFCVLYENEVVSITYPGHPFIDEFEIHIETIDSPEHRRKGLATALCARLIEYSLKKGYVPHWDAANEPSVQLALKLGYTNPVEYKTYFYPN
jgi:GNAT superfamily N-acetyltransferase